MEDFLISALLFIVSVIEFVFFIEWLTIPYKLDNIGKQLERIADKSDKS